MEHKCVDLGSDRCPCILMEVSQCYACQMIRTGKCNCGSLWQGVCPYTEYLQRGKRAQKESSPKVFKICKIKSFSPTLTVLTLEVPLAYGVKCKELGAFLMLKWRNWFIPISVLEVKTDYEEQVARVDLAVNASGPKTVGLLKSAIVGQDITVKGPFYSGILGKDRFDSKGQNIIVAKGIAVMPIINIKESLKCRLREFVLDTSKLTKEFLEEYLWDMDYRKVDFEKDSFEISESLREQYGYALESQDGKPNLFFMMSPYYVERLLKLTSFADVKVITPNHSNMCCGEGICGSCSYTDEDGRTVRPCKCMD